MHKPRIASFIIIAGLALASPALTGLRAIVYSAPDSIGSIAGAVYQARNTKDGVVLTITAKEPATVKKIQAAAGTLAAAKAVNANPDEMVVCPVYGTAMKKSRACDSTVYQGRTYYFCCAACKPEFLKNPKKYIK